MLDEQLIAQLTSGLALLKPAHAASLGGMEPWWSLTIYCGEQNSCDLEKMHVLPAFLLTPKWLCCGDLLLCTRCLLLWPQGSPWWVSFYPSFFHQLFCTLLKTSSTEGLSWGLELTGITFVWHGAALVCPRTGPTARTQDSDLQ